jgi:hypothetical protein
MSDARGRGDLAARADAAFPLVGGEEPPQPLLDEAGFIVHPGACQRRRIMSRAAARIFSARGAKKLSNQRLARGINPLCLKRLCRLK